MVDELLEIFCRSDLNSKHEISTSKSNTKMKKSWIETNIISLNIPYMDDSRVCGAPWNHPIWVCYIRNTFLRKFILFLNYVHSLCPYRSLPNGSLTVRFHSSSKLIYESRSPQLPIFSLIIFI